MNLSDYLTVENIFTLQLLKFSHQWHKKQLSMSIFDEHLQYASDVDHSYHTPRYAVKGVFYKAHFRTNAGKKTTSALAVDCWRQLPFEMKNLSNFNFSKKGQTISVIKARLRWLDRIFELRYRSTLSD